MNTTLQSQQQLEQRYRDAVEALLPAAMTDTSGGRAAAQVLLSAYNGNEFHLDVTDLGNLDTRLFAAALDVIQLRTLANREPHELVENGNSRFLQVWERWECLHVHNRYKKAVLTQVLESIQENVWDRSAGLSNPYITADEVIRKELESQS